MGEEESATRTYVEYVHAPNRRGLLSADWASLGLEGREDLWWDADNNWRIPLDELDVPEELVPELFNEANEFRLIEVDEAAEAAAAEEEPAE